MHTNPTLGRGVSMAYIQALRLAEALSEGDPTTSDFVHAFEDWRVQELSVWFNGQAKSDYARINQMDAALAGATPQPESDPIALFFAAAQAVVPTDPAVAMAFARMANMLITPAEFAADPAVRGLRAPCCGARSAANDRSKSPNLRRIGWRLRSAMGTHASLGGAILITVAQS